MISPLALEVVVRIDRIFDIERGITGKTADERLAVRQDLVTPLVAELEHWLREQRAMLARHTPVAVAIDYMLKDWTAFTRFLADGRICRSCPSTWCNFGCGTGLSSFRRPWV